MGILQIDPLLMLPGLLFGIVFHEYAHALSAKIGGDMTATHQGRLSLDPLVHIDPVGTVVSRQTFTISSILSLDILSPPENLVVKLLNSTQIAILLHYQNIKSNFYPQQLQNFKKILN